jgi:hypothetical protein
MRKAPPYNPLTDFTPVSLIGKFGFFLFVHPSVPAPSLAELLAYARANPGKLNYATGNSTSILATAQLKLRERIDIMEIPYKGDAPATTDLVAGRVQLMFATPGTGIGVREGRPTARVGHAAAESQSAAPGGADDGGAGLQGALDRAMGGTVRDRRRCPRMWSIAWRGKWRPSSPVRRARAARPVRIRSPQLHAGGALGVPRGTARCLESNGRDVGIARE